MNEPLFSRYVLKVSCPDQKGLIASCTQVLAKAGANILDLTQHTTLDLKRFFLRAVFECSEESIGHIRNHIEELAKRCQMDWDLYDNAHTRRLALFGSKTDHCIYELLLSARDGDMRCDFICIISNHHELENVASQFKVPFYFVSSDLDKPAQEVYLRKVLAETHSEALVLARYMQILSPEFTREWAHKIINIHHGFLPAFKGAKPYHQAWAKGVKIIGATAHFATEDLDQGPIIWQSVQQVDDTCSVDQFIRIGKDVEKRTLAKALRLWLEHRVFVFQGRTFIL